MLMKRTSVKRGWMSSVAAVCVALACTAMAGPAGAQFGGGMRGLQDLNEPEFNARDILTLQRVLTLDDGQRMLVEAFLEEYQTTFRTENEKYRMQQEEIRESIRSGGMEGRDWREMIEPIRQASEAFRQTRNTLGQQFLADTQAILTTDQAEQWPQFELVMRREKAIPRGMLSGESVDLFAVVAAANVDEGDRVRLEPVLNDYAAQLDSALQQREADMPRAEEEVVEGFRSGDLDGASQAVERQLRLRTRIRDINEQFSRMIEAELTGPNTFHEEYLKAAYPSAYGDDYYVQLFDAALGMPDLDDTQRANIESLQLTFDQRMASMNQELARTVRENEPKQLELMVERVRSRMNGRDGDRDGGWNVEDPIREGFNERREVSDQFRDQLEALLTPQQVESLPPQPRRPRGQFGGFEGGRFQRGDQWNGDDDDDDDDDDDGDRGGPTTPPVDGRGFPPGMGGGSGRGG